jgi:hypothetical protein
MSKVIKFSPLFVIILIGSIVFSASGCGSKRSPTGGKEDVDRPTVLASIPVEFDEISDQKIELTFSKAIDRASFLKGMYIYPPVANKKIYYEANLVTIKFLEALEKDTNYFVTLTTRIKDVRGNALGKNQTLIYRHGKLQKNRISGNVTYENATDNGLPVQMNLLTSDSLWVMAMEITGNSYALEALNPMAYILRAYIDKNLNGRYDPNLEPYQECDIANQPLAAYDLHMAYADTVKPALKSVYAVSDREYLLTLNKSVKSFQKVLIQSVNKKEHLQIFAVSHELDKITVLTAPTDTSKWQFNLIDAIDNKGNVNSLSSLTVNGSRIEDKTPPVVVKTNPRNGASVNTLQPVLEITWSEIIPQNMFHAALNEVESNLEIPFKIVSWKGKTIQIQPLRPLTNYKTCLLTIENSTSDISGNTLQKPFKLVILPLVRDKAQTPK